MHRRDAGKQADEFGWFSLGRRATALAEQEDQGRFRAGSGVAVLVDTSEKGIAAFNAVSKAMGDQKVESAIDGDRTWPPRPFANAIHDLVSRNRRMALQHRLQHLPPLFGKAQTFVAAALLGACNGTTAADLMIVVGIVEQGSLQASSTVYSRPRRPEKD